MAAKSNSTNTKRRKRGRRGGRGNGGSGLNRIVTISGTEDFATMGLSWNSGETVPYLGAVTGGTTISDIGVITGIEGKYVPVAPGVFGRRILNIADNFAEYRIMKLLLDYKPIQPFANTLTATASSVSNAINYTATGYTGSAIVDSAGPLEAGGTWDIAPDWTVAVGYQDDPSFQGSYTASEIVYADGKWVNMLKPWNFRPKIRRRWLFMPSPPDGFSVASDLGTLRTQYMGQLNFMWRFGTDGSTTPVELQANAQAALYLNVGTLRATWTCQFRCPIDPDVTNPGVSLVDRQTAIRHYLVTSRPQKNAWNFKVKLDDEKKEIGDSPVHVMSLGLSSRHSSQAKGVKKSS